MDEAVEGCRLCGRDGALTFHHLVPRTLHRNKWFRKHFTREQLHVGIDVCRDCHSAIHRFVPDHKQLGRQYNTVQKLREHPEIANFVTWIRGRRTGRVRTRRPNASRV